MSCAAPLFTSVLIVFALTSPAIAQDATIPFELQDNLIRVPIRLNGQQIEAVLDSGTGGIGIDRNFAISHGLELGPSIGDVSGGGKPQPMYPLTLNAVDFGPERMEHVSAVAFDLQALSKSAGFPVDVLLGLPAFAETPLLIDYPGRKIVFLQKGVEPTCSNPIAVTFWGGTPVANVTLQSSPTSTPEHLRLIIDLGTRHFAAMIGGAFLDTEEGQKLEKEGHAEQVGTGTGGAVAGTSVSISSLSVGSKEFHDLKIALTRNVGPFSQGAVDGSLGVPLWEHGTLIFDYPHQKFCLENPPTAQRPQ